MNDYTKTPNLGLYKPEVNADYDLWGDHLNANADTLDAALASIGSTTVTTVLAYGADPTGVADSAPAFQAALATGLNVYAPAGTYRINSMLTTAASAAQTLYGDGLSTILQIDQVFDPSVPGVINLGGTEQCATTLRDFWIRFIQPSTTTATTAAAATGQSTITVASTANVLLNYVVSDDTNSGALSHPTTVAAIAGNVITLSTPLLGSVASGDTISFAPPRSMFRPRASGGTSVPGGTGVQYPPAIWHNNVGRWRVYRLRISNAWDGIIQAPGSSSGGWWIEQIEISAINRGLSVRDNWDVSRVKGWHHWPYDMSGAQHQAHEDGGTFAMIIGDGATSGQDVLFVDVTVVGARIKIDGGDTSVYFANLILDSGSVLENNFSTWTSITNLSISPKTSVQNGDASVKMTLGTLQIVNIEGVNDQGALPIIKQTGGVLNLSNGELFTSNIDRQMITLIAGNMSIRGVTFTPGGASGPPGPPALTPWSIAAIHVQGGTFNFVGNNVHAYVTPAPAPTGFLQIDNDNPAHVVDGIAWPDTHYFTPPSGSQGNYGIRRASQTYNFGLQPVIFAEYGDQITVTTAVSATGASVITVASVIGVLVGNVVTDTTTPGAIQPGTTVVSIGAFNGTTGYPVTLSAPLLLPAGMANGDVIHFTLPSGIGSITMLTTSSAGSVHLAANAPALVNDSALFVNGGVYCDNSLHVYANPASGSTVNLVPFGVVTAPALTHILQPSGALVALTVVMPAAPAQNTYLRLATTQTITALTLQANAGQTITPPPTTLAANTALLYLFTGSEWFGMQSAGAVGTSAALSVLAFGADPTGVADSSAAFQAAANVVSADGVHHAAVYAPAGTYRINNQITLSAAQTLYGDGRGSTILKVDQAFSSSATAVIVSTIASGVVQDSGAEIHDLAISFAQPSDLVSRVTMKTLAAGGTSGTGGTGIKYPPAIVFANGGRCKVLNLWIGGAWIGIQNTGNCPFFIDNVEVGALNMGADLGNVIKISDFSHMSAYHFWPFGFFNSGVVSPPFSDGQTIALNIGSIDGFEANGITVFSGKIIFTPIAANSWYFITNLMCDGPWATLTIGGAKWMKITNFYTAAYTTDGSPLVSIPGTGLVRLVISNWFSWGSSTVPVTHLLVNGGDVQVSDAYMQEQAINTQPDVLVSAGTLRLYNAGIGVATGTHTAPLVSQTGGVLQVSNLNLYGSGAISAVGVSYTVDSIVNYLGRVGLGPGITNTVPATFTLGHYTGFSPLASPIVSVTVATVAANTVAVAAGVNYVVVQDSINAVNTLTVGSGTLSDGYDLWLSFPNGGTFSGIPVNAHGNITLKTLGGGWSILSKYG